MAEPEYLKGIFLNGLKEVVRAELKLHQASNLPELMDLAQRIDEKNVLLSKGSSWVSKGGDTTRSYNHSRIESLGNQEIRVNLKHFTNLFV